MKTSSKFPEKNTEEEEMLLQKYALLKQLRKQLTELHSRQAAEAENIREKEEMPIKTSEDARVAAERLVKLGKIKIQSACPPRVLMKKGRDSAGPSSAYRPYSPTGGLADDVPGGQQQQPPPAKRPRANLYDSFVSGGVQDPTAAAASAPPSGVGGSGGEPSRPRGNTLFVQGYNIHPDMLRAAFSPFGPISRISMETRGGRFGDAKASNKPKAFVTFELEDDAGNAMDQLDGQLVKGSVLSVRLARKQPTGQPFRGGRGGHPPPQLLGISDWTSGGEPSFRRRLGLGFASPDAPSAADDDAPPFENPPQPPATDAEEVISSSAAQLSDDQRQQQQMQRRPLEYSDDVFVSSDPMEEDAIAELEEVM